MIDRIRDGRTDLVFEFVRAGGEADHRDDRGVPLIRWCAYYGDVSAIRYLVDRGESLSALGDNLDLNGACFHGHWRLCQFLVESGADVNHPLPQTRETPLHAALCKPARPAYDHVVRILLANGADPDVATLPGIETGSFMRDVRTVGERPLHRAAAYGSERAVRMLLEAGASVDALDANGESPIAWASRHLRSNDILRLLQFGDHRIHPDAPSDGDRGTAWSAMDAHLLGRPHT